jgi:Ni,Fe-hydrogenase III large subunit
MSVLQDMIGKGRIAASRPWPRAITDRAGWRAAADRLAEGTISLLALWGDAGAVHLALIEGSTAGIGMLTFECPDGRFPSISAVHPPALRLERALRDLYGFVAEGIPDERPWLDHGRWGVRHPLGAARESSGGGGSYDFLPAQGEGLHQIPVGPVHAGIIEPGHFRFTANGEAVVRLEERLGYDHKGIEGLMQGADLIQAAKLAGRTSGDSTVAYAYAFARAAEAALEIEPPARARWLPALMAELERLANHFGDIGAVCSDASFALMHAHCGVLRERVLRAAGSCFGHRLMRDAILPGGVAADLSGEGTARLRALVAELRRHFPSLVELYDNTASLQDRTVGTGILKPELARQYACGGFIGRASGRGFDARRQPGYAPYDQLAVDVPVLKHGDVNARVWIRIREVEQSLALVDKMVDGLRRGRSGRSSIPSERCAKVQPSSRDFAATSGSG